MKIILQNDVKNLGKVGDVVNVSKGFARNFLFPKRLAVLAAENSVKAWEHLKKVSELRKKKAVLARKALLQELSGVTLTFKMASADKEKIFGSISAHDISVELEKKGHSIDRRDIKMEPIRLLGQHKVTISLGEDLSSEVTVVVEKLLN